MVSREDEEYWSDLYSNAPDCKDDPDHGSDNMLYEVGRWFCCKCAYDDKSATEPAHWS